MGINGKDKNGIIGIFKWSIFRIITLGLDMNL